MIAIRFSPSKATAYAVTTAIPCYTVYSSSVLVFSVLSIRFACEVVNDEEFCMVGDPTVTRALNSSKNGRPGADALRLIILDVTNQSRCGYRMKSRVTCPRDLET